MKWEKVKLGDICEFAYGKSLASKARSGNGYPVYGSNGEVGLHDEALTQSETIIIGRKGSFGEINYCPGPCSPIDTTYYVTKENTDAHIPWLARRLKCLGLNNLNRAAAIPGLNRADAYRQNLLLPPLDEQKRIAGILDAADALRFKRRESLAKLDDLLRSTFLDMFGDPVTNPKGWEVKAFKDVIKDLTSKAEKVLKSDYDNGSMWPIIDQSQNEIAGFADHSEPFRVPLPVVIFGDHTRCVKLVQKPFLLGADGAKVLSTVNGLESVTLKFMLPLLKIPNLGYSRHMKEVKRLTYILPPLDLQQRFAKIVTSVEEQKAKMKKHLEQLDGLFASLQQRAFRGDL